MAGKQEPSHAYCQPSGQPLDVVNPVQGQGVMQQEGFGCVDQAHEVTGPVLLVGALT